MPISIFAALSQANQLRSYEKQLNQAKNSLRDYRATVSANWQADEVAHVNKAIDLALSDINAAINQLSLLSNDVRNVAEQIRLEEEAAAAAANTQK